MSIRAITAAALVLVLATLCFAPTLSATVASPSLQADAGVGYVDLNWQTVPWAEHYHLYRGGADAMVPVANVSAPFTAYHDSEVEQGANYLYYVTAWANGTESAPSNTISVTIPAEEEDNIILPVLAIVLSVIAVQMCIVMLLYFFKQKMKLK